MRGKRYNRHWWDDEDEYYQGRYGNIFEESDAVKKQTAKDYSKSGGYSYKSYFYKKSYDFSVGLETRVRQLIKTISGKDLKLAQADGWGSDDDYFYYNASDLDNASDDEVLGLIFHQLSRELFYDGKLMKKLKKDEPAYKHLIETLEDCRVDRPMVDRYNGADYYLETVWHDLKKESTKPRGMYGSKPIPAMEFCYNATVAAHGQADFSGHDQKALTAFLKAVPSIEAYLASPTLEAALKHYPAIKKAYPKPDEQQQQEMDNLLGGNMLSDQRKKQAHRQAATDDSNKRGRDMEMQAESFGVGDDEKKKLQNPDYAAYAQVMAEQQGTIAVLHKLLASIIADNDTKRYIGRMKRGKIDGKALHKLVAFNSDRIFKKEREVKQKKYAFSILVDQSGSMNGQRIQNAFAGTVILTEVFNRLGIPFQITGFDTASRNYKKFFSPPRREVIGGMRWADGGGTNDRRALDQLNESLKGMHGFSKSVFVLTDGEGQGGDTQHVVSAMTKKDNVNVFALGLGLINDEALKRTYNRYAVANDVSQLPRILVDLVREQFRRG